jgi:hypothetical protein
MPEERNQKPLAVPVEVEWVEHVFTHPLRNALPFALRKELITLESLGYQILARYIPKENGDKRYVGYEVYSHRDQYDGGEGRVQGLVQCGFLGQYRDRRDVKDVERGQDKPRGKSPTDN